MTIDVTPTTVIVQAAYWSCDKFIKDDEGKIEEIPPFKFCDVSVQKVEGPRAKSKLVFWFEKSPHLKRVELLRPRVSCLLT